MNLYGALDTCHKLEVEEDRAEQATAKVYQHLLDASLHYYPRIVFLFLQCTLFGMKLEEDKNRHFIENHYANSNLSTISCRLFL